MRDSNQALMLLSYKEDNCLTLSLYNQHITKINQALKQVKAAWIDILAENIRPLAHLSTVELLTLLEDCVIPLSQRYAYLRQQSEVANATLDDNQQKLLLLKQQIYQGLHLRCKISNELHLPRQVDDLEAYALRSHHAKLATLNDDSRLIIYDLLCEAGFNKQILYEDVIAAIPKRSYKTVRKPQKIRQALIQMYQFTHHINDTLKLKPPAPGRFATQMQNLQRKLSLSLPWPFLGHIRYVLYFMLSLSAYALVLQAFSPLSVFLLNEKLFALLASGAFYTVGLFPLWWLVSQTLRNTFNGFSTWWLSVKKSQVIESLYTLERVQQLISYRLSQVIVDITHHDFALLHQKIIAEQKTLQELNKKLPQFSWMERLIGGSQLKMQAVVINQKMHRTEEALQVAIQKMIKHIIARVKEELTLLEESIHRRALVPVLPTNQYINIKLFIQRYGTQKDLQTYEEQANITHLWRHKLEYFTLKDMHSDLLTLNQPWGSHVLRKDVMRGWRILLSELGDVNGPSKQALEIHQVLQGKQELSLIALTQAVTQVAKQKPEILLQKIQMIIFNTLSNRAASQAKLLSLAQKELIANWYHKHQKQINWANCIMQQAFASQQKDNRFERLTNAQLARCYELLDSADIYNFSRAQDEQVITRDNLAKTYFESYQGQSSRAFRLLRFLPEQVKNKQLVDVAKKRLTWILSHLDKNVLPSIFFDEIDIEFFLHHDLSRQHAIFNVAQTIRNSAEFNKPWTASMERFLKSCRDNGLDSGKLLEQYQSKNRRTKSFLVQHVVKEHIYPQQMNFRVGEGNNSENSAARGISSKQRTLNKVTTGSFQRITTRKNARVCR